MDSFDRRLLKLLQEDNRRSNADLGERVGLSESAVRRRTAALRASGVIRADVSLLDPARLGVTVIVSIRFEKESAMTYTEFKAHVLSNDAISQCYTVSGDDDFILVGHFTDMGAYDDWVNAVLLTNPAIARSTTNVVYRCVKNSTAIPV